jgi:hypothetical protein
MSFGTFESGLAFNSERMPVVNPPNLTHAENAIFSGLFDSTYDVLAGSPDEATAHRVLDELFNALREKKLHTPHDEWRKFIAVAQTHRVMSLLHRDPFTYRAFSKPRGYAGDAVMMDFIYGREEYWPIPPCDAIGEHIFNFTTQAPASEGVRSRRAHIAARIDRLAEDIRRPHIMAIASGHLREVNLSSAIRRRKTGRIVALDADAQSLAEVDRCYGRYGVETVTASFREMLGGGRRAGEFDFVYSTGLFDYLNQKSARRLVTGMFKMLRPGGTLLVANFLPNVRDIGYMETFMGWDLIYRSRSEMVDLTMDIPEEDVDEVLVLSEEYRNIVFLELVRS